MIIVREARESDLPAMLAIYNEVIVNSTAVYMYEPVTADVRKAWYETKLKDGLPVFVAEADGDVVGFSSYGPFRAWPAYKYTVENSVYVLDSQRGKGIGKLLMAPLIGSAKAAGMHAVVAGIDSSNGASIRLHESFGFEEVAHFRQVGYKFGRWLDLTFMQLLLDTPEHPADG